MTGRAGAWSAEATEAILAGDDEAFGNALPEGAARGSGSWAPAQPASIGRASWRFSMLVVGDGDLDAAER